MKAFATRGSARGDSRRGRVRPRESVLKAVESRAWEQDADLAADEEGGQVRRAAGCCCARARECVPCVRSGLGAGFTSHSLLTEGWAPRTCSGERVPRTVQAAAWTCPHCSSVAHLTVHSVLTEGLAWAVRRGKRRRAVLLLAFQALGIVYGEAGALTASWCCQEAHPAALQATMPTGCMS